VEVSCLLERCCCCSSNRLISLEVKLLEGALFDRGGAAVGV
jgi:hypothetical protein